MAKKGNKAGLVEKPLPPDSRIVYTPPTPKQMAVQQMQGGRESRRWSNDAVRLPIERERISSGGLADDPTESGEPVRNPKPFGKLSEG